MIVTTAKALKAELNGITVDTCPACNGKMELIFEDCLALVDGKHITLRELAQLKCSICGHQVLSGRSKAMLLLAYEECKKYGKPGLDASPKTGSKSYPFCTGYNFLYDHRDYENIPGLGGMRGDGFLTPVFFKKEALVYFMHNPDYELNLGSETYGTLAYKDKSITAFGINTNGRVVMWLGDLDSLDDNTLRFLQSQNVPSDHTLMASEFYDAQLKCRWSEPIVEAQIVNKRIRFYELQKAKKGLDLYHLDQEVIDVIDGIKKPIMYSEDEIKAVVTSLHKILVEAVTIPALKAFYKVQTGKEPSDEWKSIRYIEFLLSQQSQKDIRLLMSGPYVLNDLRNLFSHLVSVEKQEKLKQNAVTAFGLPSFILADVYRVMLDRLMALYEELVQTT